MPQPDPRSLGAALQSAAPLAGRALRGVDKTVLLSDLLTHTVLDRPHRDLAGRTVLLAARDQFLSAVALTELDGRARRLVLCPPDLKPEHGPAIVAATGADAIVTDAEPGSLPGTSALQAIGCRWPPTPLETATGSSVATEWLLLTSGTTGAPKVVQHDLAGLTAAIRPRNTTGRPLVWSTFYDIRRYGGLQIFFRGLLGTGSLVLSGANEPIADHLTRLGRENVTHISGTPSHWRRALMSPAIAAISPDYIRLSGEIADQTILDSLREAFPQADIGHAYASTEAGVGFEVDDGLEGFPAHYLDRRDSDVELKVVDSSLRIRSRRAASRYVGDADAVLADADGFIDTGDMVERRGDRLFFVGRRNGVINVGGLKVHPEEIEAVINRHDEVRMSLVQGRRNPITGAIVVAAVVLKAGEGAPDAPAGERVRDEIMAECRKALPPHKVPAVLRFVPSLEVTPAGKLVRPHA